MSPSLLYDQRAMLCRTRRYLRGRRALTAYHTSKRDVSIGEASCLILGEHTLLAEAFKQGEKDTGLHHFKVGVSQRSQTSRLRDRQ
jgi:hypothetical protein